MFALDLPVYSKPLQNLESTWSRNSRDLPLVAGEKKPQNLD